MARKIIKDGLQFYYDGKYNVAPWAHSTDTRYWYDLSGNNRTARLYEYSGRPSGKDPWGDNYLSFENNDGNAAQNNFSNQGILVGWRQWSNFYPELENEMTCEIFIESDEAYSQYPSENPLIGNIEYGSGGFYIYTAISGDYAGKIVLEIYDSKNNYSLQYCSIPMEKNKKILISLVVKNRELYFYINGILINSQISTYNYILQPNYSKNNTKFAIGMSPYDTTSYGRNHKFRRCGKIYSARLYNRALSENEVYYNYLAEMDHFNGLDVPTDPDYPNIPDVEPDIGDIVVPIEDGQVSKISIKGQEIYNIKDTKSRITKVDKYEDDIVYGNITYMNGFQIDLATVKYDIVNNTVIFE